MATAQNKVRSMGSRYCGRTIGGVNPRTRRLIVTGVLLVLVAVAVVGALWNAGQ